MGSGCFNRLPATHVRGNSVRGNLPGQCLLTSPVASLLVSPYVFIFLNFLLNLLPSFHVFTGTVQRQAHPCCPLVPVPASIVPHHVVSGLFWALFPWFLMAWESLECLCVALLEVFNLPEHGAQTCATKKPEATCVGKELLKDLLHLLSGREPSILFYFLSYLYCLIVPEVCSNPKVSEAVAISTGSLLVLLSVRIKK